LLPVPCLLGSRRNTRTPNLDQPLLHFVGFNLCRQICLLYMRIVAEISCPFAQSGMKLVPILTPECLSSLIWMLRLYRDESCVHLAGASGYLYQAYHQSRGANIYRGSGPGVSDAQTSSHLQAKH